MLMLHSVFMIYENLRSLFGRTYPMTSYRALQAKYVTTSDMKPGIDYLIKKEFCSLETMPDTNIPAFSFKGLKDANIIQNSSANNCRAYLNSFLTVKKHIEQDTNIKTGFLMQIAEEIKPHTFIPADQLEILQFFQGRLPLISDILIGYKKSNDSSFSIADYNKYCKAQRNFSAYLEENPFMTVTDKLHFYYQIEKLFNFDLIDCIFQNIQSSPENLAGGQEIYHLCKALAMPNVFSRKYMIQMAFDLLKKGTMQNENFFSNYLNDIENFGSYLNMKSPFFKNAKNLELWMELYEKFVTYLSNFALPVYVNTFFVILYQSHKIKYNLSYAETLIDIYKQLTSFIDKNHVYYHSLNGAILNTEQKKYEKPRKCVHSTMQFIHPDFSRKLTKMSDANLYGRVLLGAKYVAKDIPESAPFFITKKRLLSALPNADQYAQAYYILNYYASEL